MGARPMSGKDERVTAHRIDCTFRPPMPLGAPVTLSLKPKGPGIYE